MAKIEIQMSIHLDDDQIANATDKDLIEWLLFEVGKKRERRKLPEPLDRFDISFTHEPKFDRIIKIERGKSLTNKK